MKKEKFIFMGTFDPFTRGHMGIVCQALEDFETGIIAVAESAAKDCLFSVDERINQIHLFHLSLKYYGELTSQDFESRLQVVSYSGMSVDIAYRYDATMIRGIRGNADVENEARLAAINAGLMRVRGFHLDQKSYLQINERTFISSSATKALCQYGEYILAMEFVFPPVHNIMMEEYLGKVFDESCFFNECKMSWEIFVEHFANRSYHNLSHIAYMLNRLALYEGKVENMRWLKSAIFFHDYEQGPNGEEKSFEVSGLPEAAKGLFLATKHLDDERRELHGDERLIHDFDLSILFDKQNYEDYALCVRQEYLEIPLKTFVTKRIAVLRKLQDTLHFYVYSEHRTCDALVAMKREVQGLISLLREM